MARIGCPKGMLALDIPCGFGRHARWLAQQGARVIGADLDPGRAGATQAAREGQDNDFPVVTIVADLEKSLPFRDVTFDLALVIHYFSETSLRVVQNVVKRGGFLIVETFGAQGRNWESLPESGELERILRGGFRILEIRERSAGPGGTRAVSMALAQRL